MQLTSAADQTGLADEQRALRRVATLVAEGVEPQDLFAVMAEEAADLIGAPITGIVRYEPDGSATLVASFLKGDASGLLTPPARLAIDGKNVLSSVLETSEAARIDDYSAAYGELAETVRRAGITSTVGTPIVVAGRVWGTMLASATDREPLPEDTAEHMAGFTQLLATAIENVDSQQALERLVEQEAALRRVATLVADGTSADELFASVTEEVGRLFGAEAGIARFEPDGSALVIVGLTEGIPALSTGTRVVIEDYLASATVYRTGSPARRTYGKGPLERFAAEYTGGRVGWGTGGDDAGEENFVSSVAAPIVVGGSVWGNIIVDQQNKDLPPDTEERLGHFTELVASAIANAESRTELAASEARAHALAEQQAALRRVATLVARAPVSEQFFSTVAGEVASVLNVPGVLVDRFEADGTIVTVGAAFDSELSGAERVFALGTRMPPTPRSLAAQVFETRGAARVDDFSKLEGPIGDLARAAALGSGCGGPIVVNGDLWGLMCVFSQSETILPAGTENRLHDFIELVATAIANYESRVNVERLAAEQSALRRVATLVAREHSPEDLFATLAEEVGLLFGVDASAILRYEADSTATVVAGWSEGAITIPLGQKFPLEGENLAGDVHGTGKPGRKEDYADAAGPIAATVRELRIRGAVASPIVVEGATWGVMAVLSRKPEPLPLDTEARLAEFTGHAGIAVANAKSRSELAASEARARELADEQAALRRVATLVAQGASPDELFSAVADEVAGVLGIPTVGLRRYEADGTFTILGNVGDISSELTVGSRWPVNEGVTGTILATGLPVRRDDGTTSTVGVPIVVEGNIWGFIGAADMSGRPLPADTEDRLARFTELIATAVSNATTRSELLTSRARLVSAADETRRRLERDLHDGIQQWLVGLALRARKAAGRSAAGDSAVQELTGLADDLVAVTDELRELSRGIHPAILSDAGLDDALEALVRRSAMRVHLDVSFRRRYDPTLEATIYYVVAESITNAVKHARASTVAVRGGLRSEAIELEIRDDGIGGADPRRGTGLIGLKDRVDTLGGTISFTSVPGAGTTISLKLPAAPRD